MWRIEPAGSWYLESGQGMGQTLLVANEKKAYTLTDRGTYLAFRKRVSLPQMKAVLDGMAAPQKS